MPRTRTFYSLNRLASKLREELKNKDYILLYAYNSIGKTRLSNAFKEIGKGLSADDATEVRDTLYYNAFTEDLFTWDNDLENDKYRFLKLNQRSRFFDGLHTMEMETRIRPLLERYADFEFSINMTDWEVYFDRHVNQTIRIENRWEIETFLEQYIKISRGEENIFIWCFFLAIIQLVLDDDGNGPYSWVKYIYIDDPISSLDEHNAISVAHHLSKILNTESQVKTVISTHHALFFNVLYNELNNANKYFLSRNKSFEEYTLKKTGDTPFFQHTAILTELYEACRTGKLFTYHFNMLRTLLEKTANFHGYRNFSECIKLDDKDDTRLFHTRMINILNHGNYSLFEPKEMQEENKQNFRKILDKFIKKYPFNPTLYKLDNNRNE